MLTLEKFISELIEIEDGKEEYGLAFQLNFKALDFIEALVNDDEEAVTIYFTKTKRKTDVSR